MNSEKNRALRDRLYFRGIQQVIKSVAFLLGVPVTDDVKTKLSKASYPVVVGVRRLIISHAYHDYANLVGKDRFNMIPLTRFTPEVWQTSINNVVEDVAHVTVSAIEEIGMSGDYWSRDAEWGERLQLAKADERVGRIARVDFEPPTCPYCTLLNSRGPVYANEDSFLHTLHAGDTCSAVFVLQGEDDYPGKEHTAQSLERYKKAVRTLGPGKDANAIMAELKNQNLDTGPGKVRQVATQAAEAARVQRVKELTTTNASLNKLHPKSDAHHTIRDEEITRNAEILNVLETK